MIPLSNGSDQLFVFCWPWGELVTLACLQLCPHLQQFQLSGLQLVIELLLTLSLFLLLIQERDRQRDS